MTVEESARNGFDALRQVPDLASVPSTPPDANRLRPPLPSRNTALAKAPTGEIPIVQVSSNNGSSATGSAAAGSEKSSDALRQAALVAEHLDLIAELITEIAQRISDRRRSSEGSEEADEIHYVESLSWDLLTAYGTKRTGAVLELATEQAIVNRIKAELYDLGGFELYLNDPTIENMYVNGSDRVFLDRAGASAPERVPPVTRNDDDLVELINRWAARAGRMERRFDLGNPRLDLRLPTGHRLHAIMEVTQRPTVTIRFPHHKTVTMRDQVEFGTVSPAMADFLRAAVKARCNIIVAGGTGAGKTTLLRALLLEVDSNERIITIEDTPELNLAAFEDTHPNVVEMETRQANSEGLGELTMMELTRECLRMSPDRVVLGEVRGAEALYMLKAMSQGNDGSMCTIHADSARGVAGRVRAYCAEGAHGLPMEVIDSFFINAVDLVIHIHRLPDRRRVISSIYEVEKTNSGQILYNAVFAETANSVAQFETMPSALLADRLRVVGLNI